MKKINIISDKNKKSKKIRNFILKKIKNLKNIFYSRNLIIVVGGDGFMLRTLKKFTNFSNLLFYGINSGNYGFLMNKFSGLKTLKNIMNSKKVTISPLEMIVKNKEEKIKKFLAINEVYILRSGKQAANLSIKIKNKFIIKKLISDGVLVSTPAGSTAYNLSVHGPILNLNSKKLSVSPISPFRPRRWKGKIINQNSKIIIKNLDVRKRPLNAVADNYEVKNAKTIKIKIKDNIKFNLLYDKNQGLNKKIKLEQIRKEIN